MRSDKIDRGKTEQLGVAVVGAGYWGPNLVRNIQACEQARLRWVCDLDLERALRAVGSYSTVQTTDSLDDILDDRGVQAVAIATPAATHRDLALACLEAGKHVLVEKPLAPTVSDARKLVEVANERGLVLMCDHTYCYTPAVRGIREMVFGGVLGDIQYLDFVRINLGLIQSDVDVFWDLAPHDLSIIDFILPDGCRPEAVAAHGSDPIGAGRDCVGYLTLRLHRDLLAHIHVNWLSPVKVRTTIIGGSRRTLVWDDLAPSQRLSLYDRGVDVTGAADSQLRREALVSYRLGDMVAPALPEQEALGGVIKEFAAAIYAGRPPLTDGASGLRVLEVLEAGRRSLQSGGAFIRPDTE
ncbi:MAG: Gfo/Idh/MocA family oxidoreductase [Actinomycetota bacterium]|nr:Gfo/Idh/MocA family oxidoreductase [Actinomycetota bacterium]